MSDEPTEKEPPRESFKFVAFHPDEIEQIRRMADVFGMLTAHESRALLIRVSSFLREFSTSSGIPMGAPLPSIPDAPTEAQKEFAEDDDYVRSED